METGFTRWIDALKSIPEFQEEVEALQLKFKCYPPQATYQQQTDYLTQFQVAVNAVDKKIRDWLKKEFPSETGQNGLFRDSGGNTVGFGVDYNQPCYKGLDPWLNECVRPTPHGGYPGAQWGFDTSVQGQLSKLCPALVRAYHLCKEEKERKRKLAEEAKKKEEEETRRYNEAQAKRIQREQEYFEANKLKQVNHWINALLKELVYLSPEGKPTYNSIKWGAETYRPFELIRKQVERQIHSVQKANEFSLLVKEEAEKTWKRLIEKSVEELKPTLTLHYFPIRVEDGVRRPAEWKPDFNLNTMAKVEAHYGKVIAEAARKRAWAETEEQRKTLLNQERKKESIVVEEPLFREV